MKIVLHCEATFPAKNSMGAERTVESIAKGLKELGHEVTMWTNPDSDENKMFAPLVKECPKDFDIIHANGRFGFDKPYISVVHGGGSDPKGSSWHNNPHTVCVSDFICKLSNNKTYVHSCVDPSDFIYKEKKQDYFVWIAGTDWADGKFLFGAIQLAKKMKFKLKIAGTGKNQQVINAVRSLCDGKIEFIGAINGREKAEFLANAKALLFYTRLPDACPLTVAESLISGTPIIGSMNGSLPEIIPNNCGILCREERELPKAILNINKIKSIDCRNYAMNNYSHIVTAKKFIQIYKNMLEHGTTYGA